jgi:hypothetical protein
MLRLGRCAGPPSGPAHRLFGWMLYLAHRPASAEQWPQAALVPNRGPLQTLSACPCLPEPRSLRRLPRAGGAAPYRPPNPLSLSVLGAWLAHLDQREEAPNVVATRRERQTEAGHIESHAIAQVHITLGNVDWAIGCPPEAWTRGSLFRHLSNLTRNSIRSVGFGSSATALPPGALITLQVHSRRRKPV